MPVYGIHAVVSPKFGGEEDFDACFLGCIHECFVNFVDPRSIQDVDNDIYAPKSRLEFGRGGIVHRQVLDRLATFTTGYGARNSTDRQGQGRRN